jgi:hypothetical protein
MEQPPGARDNTRKIYEYLDAGRPILSIGPSEGLVKDLIQSTNTGIHLSGYESVKKVLKMFYDEFQERGKIEYGGILRRLINTVRGKWQKIYHSS